LLKWRELRQSTSELSAEAARETRGIKTARKCRLDRIGKRKKERKAPGAVARFGNFKMAGVVCCEEESTSRHHGGRTWEGDWARTVQIPSWRLAALGRVTRDVNHAGIIPLKIGGKRPIRGSQVRLWVS
jgi:hypothetical protein